MTVGGVDILFEDAAIMVVDKPAGMLVHPSPGHETGTLSEILVAHCPSMASVGSAERPGVVHRLDGDTSGVMVFAKTRAAYLKLREQFESHREVRKTYLAVLHGSPRPRCGTIDEPVGRDPRRALSRWQVLAQHDGLSLVEFHIETGRMHQIRLHAKALGHPVAGDPLYGDAAADRRMRRRPGRTLLHAVELSFRHPTTGERVTFSAPPPPDLVYAC